MNLLFPYRLLLVSVFIFIGLSSASLARAATAPTFVGRNTGTGTGATYSISLTALTGGSASSAAAGDLVIVVTGWASGAGDGDPGVNTTGYTEVADIFGNDTRDANLSVNWKIMGSTPDTSVTVRGFNNAANGGATVVYVWRGVDPNTPMDATPTTSSSNNSALPDPASITPVMAGAVIVACGMGTGSSTPSTFTTPSGMSNGVSVAGTGSTMSAIANVASYNWTSGAYDPAAWTGTTSTSDSRAAVTLALRPLTAITLGSGTDPSSATVAPGSGIRDAGAFTLQSDGSNDSVTALTVTLADSGTPYDGVAEVNITSNDGATIYFSAVSNPSSNSINFSGGTPIPVTTTQTQFKIRITPKTHADMSAPAGAIYSLSPYVSSWTLTGAYSKTGSDSNSNNLIIDNASPDGATSTSGTARDMSVALFWTTSSSTDFSRSVVLRWTGDTPGSEVPVEGVDYNSGDTISSATVACVRTADSASTAIIDAIDGNGGGGGCLTNNLTNSTAYSYKIFQKDSNGNYDTGVIFTGSPFTPSLQDATKIYRSVGPSATSALANDNSHANTVVLSGGVATFSVDLPNNIGVGDAVLIDTGGTDQSIDASDTLLFIHGRTDSTHYTLRTHTGTTPSDISINDTYQIYRAYTSLFDAEAGTKNTSIPITFNGGNRDLVTNNEEWHIACYANSITADSSKVNIFGWTTGVKNFIKIYTPVTSDEVGVSQRHNGKFDTSKYNMLLSVEAISEESIYSNGNFIRIDGLQIYVYSTSGFTGTTGILAAGAVDVYISNNIVKGAVVNCASTAPRGILLGDSTGSHFAWNNIVYGFNVTGSENSSGIYAYNRSYIFNNTIYDCKFGIKAFVMDSVHAINNIVQNCTDGYNGFFHSTSDYNISSLSDDAPGANSKNSTTVQFVSTALKDFHLSSSDTAARKSGLNLSENADLSFNTDIDGQLRGLTGADWDIGADGTVAQIYRSVGPGAVGLLDSDNSHTRSITLTGGVATFSAALPDNIGVGDAVLIDTGGTDQAIDASDTLLFISDRTDSTHYSLSTHLGGKPADISINDTYQIYRAYTSLFDAEAGTKNSSIPISFNGGNRDLVLNNEQWNIACYGNGSIADTTGLSILGWNTSAGNYIRIYTPTNTNEVGLTQRHAGVWDSNKYNMEVSNNHLIDIYEDFVNIDGLQLKVTASGSYYKAIQIAGSVPNPINSGASYKISNNIMQGILSGTADNNAGILVEWYASGTRKLSVSNNIIYGFRNGSYSNNLGIEVRNGWSANISNNTFYDNYLGINRSSGNLTGKNNIAQNCTDGYNGTFGTFSDYNISDLPNDAPSSSYRTNLATDVSFVDETNKDFHLAQSDTAARGKGANQTVDVDLPITTDIDGQFRNPSGAGWDIGADEGTVEFTPTVMQSGGDYSTLSSWAAGVQTDLVASTTRVFSHSGITGTIADNATVTGQTSSATATVVHATTTQILLENISGTFQSGEVVQVTAGNSVTISDNGNPASAVAKIDGAWSVANTNQVPISGWTTGRDNYIKIYTEPAARHNGKWDESKFRLVMVNGNINSYENNIIIDGLQMYNTSTSSGFYTPGKNGRAENITIKNNIIKSDGGGTSGVWIAQWQWMQNVNVYNNIVYGFDKGVDMDISVYDSINVFNNTIYNSGTNGIYTSRTGAILKNNIVQNSPTCFGISTGSFLASSSNNVSSDATAPGNNSKTNATVSFISTTSGAEDFHLSQADTAAKNAGTDLNAYFNNDIDGNIRNSSINAWDIGADETATQIYRSVGPSATAALANDNSHANTVILTSGTANFSTALPDNIGAGDAVIIDTGGTDQTIDASDTLLFIQKRNSSTSYQLQAHSGAIPSDIAINDTYQIYRAYTSLFNAEAGTKNNSIPITFNGGDRNLITNNEEWNIAAYANGTTADTTAVTIDGWNTSMYNFMKVYTPVYINEVGVSQRHIGKWDDNKYMMQGTDQVSLLSINDDYVHIDGLQFFNQNPASNGRGLVITNDSIDNKSLISFSNNIFRGHNNSSYWQWLLDVNDSSGTDINLNIWNNLFYDLDSNSTAIYVSAGRANIYNNTIVGGNRSLHVIAGDILAINNIVQDSVAGFEGTFNAASDYNISNLSNDASGSNSKNSATVLFMDIVNKDFRLSSDDTVAKVAGVNLSNNIYLSFANDIQNKVRPALPDAWSIGACEYLKSQKVKLEGSQIKVDGNVKFE